MRSYKKWIFLFSLFFTATLLCSNSQAARYCKTKKRGKNYWHYASSRICRGKTTNYCKTRSGFKRCKSFQSLKNAYPRPKPDSNNGEVDRFQNQPGVDFPDPVIKRDRIVPKNKPEPPKKPGVDFPDPVIKRKRIVPLPKPSRHGRPNVDLPYVRPTIPMAKPVPSLRPEPTGGGEVTGGEEEDPENNNGALSFSKSYKSPRLPGGRRGFEPLCRKNYIKDDGTYGWKAEILKRELTGKGAANDYSHLFFGPALPKTDSVCPNYHKFNDDQKLNFWIWYMTAIAQTESNCGRRMVNWKDVNGISAGDMQMPERENGQRPDWRGRGCRLRHKGIYYRRRRRTIRMAQPYNNLPCAVEVLGSVLCGRYKSRSFKCNGRYAIYGHGFWAKLRRRNGGRIIKLVKRFPLCKKQK